MRSDTDEVLREQIEYYSARAPEYDEWFERRGVYDMGEEWNDRWWREVAQVRAALDAFVVSGEVLELACGTGWWTQELARRATSLTCVDASAETLELARRRAPAARFVRADIFSWEPDGAYDVVFFSFWLSHVPDDRFEAFWDLVGRSLAPDGRVFLIDNLLNPSAVAERVRRFLQRDISRDGVVVRKLNDGREFRAVKIYHRPDELAERLAGMGWRFELHSTAASFYYGGGARG